MTATTVNARNKNSSPHRKNQIPNKTKSGCTDTVNRSFFAPHFCRFRRKKPRTFSIIFNMPPVYTFHTMSPVSLTE